MKLVQNNLHNGKGFPPTTYAKAIVSLKFHIPQMHCLPKRDL